MSNFNEFFDVVDRKGNIVGRATRKECHSNPTLIHRTVHAFIMNPAGDILMPRRTLTEENQTGLWDISVSGHVALGETIRNAVSREMREGLGLDMKKLPRITLERLYEYLWRAPTKTELVTTFMFPYDGPFELNEEIFTEARFWTRDDIKFSMSPVNFTPDFMDEYERFNQMTRSNWASKGTAGETS